VTPDATATYEALYQGIRDSKGRCGMAEKMKCARCGKRFKQANRKQVFCADCLAKERLAKKNAPLAATTAGHAANGSLRQSGAGAQTAGITIVHTTPPPEAAVFGSRAREAERHAPHIPQAPQTPDHADQSATISPVQQQQPEAPEKASAASTHGVSSRQDRRPPLSAAPQPERRARPPRPAPFQLTDEVRATIEQRYLELAKPVEFDGIRTQIAGELNVPKPVVKQVIQELRASRQLPSWWELQAYKGSDEELERVRERYLPLLPTPPVGVHKQIASELQMDPPQVYQAIRRLRAEMKLPQYNPPESHESHTGEAPEAVMSSESSAAEATSVAQE
jgi:hypothetical protein